MSSASGNTVQPPDKVQEQMKTLQLQRLLQPGPRWTAFTYQHSKFGQTKRVAWLVTRCLWVQTPRLLPSRHTKSPNLWPLRWNTSIASWPLHNIPCWNLIMCFTPQTVQTGAFWLDKCSLELWGFDEGNGQASSWKQNRLEGCNTHGWNKEKRNGFDICCIFQSIVVLQVSFKQLV